MHRPPRAFTLIELLIVVAIIAILAAVALPNFIEAHTRAKVTRTHADLRTLAVAIEAYAVDWNGYPLNGIIAIGGAIESPQVTNLPAAHKFPADSLTTPVAYIAVLPDDLFASIDTGADALRRRLMARYFYTNLEWFRELASPNPPPVIDEKIAMYGSWILAGAGPDLDRLDLARDVAYDPTNGTVSDGDIIRSPRRVN